MHALCNKNIWMILPKTWTQVALADVELGGMVIVL
jgi:hypothetical protein